jgi:hypothetical protein
MPTTFKRRCSSRVLSARFRYLHPYPRVAAVDELDAGGFKSTRNAIDSLRGDHASLSFVIDHGRQTKRCPFGESWLGPIQKRSSGATLCGRHFNILC